MKICKSFIFSSFLVISFSCFAALPNIVGRYNCSGHDPFANINYHGLTTVKKTGATYSFKWDFGKKMIYTGTGIFNSHESTLLAVLFSDPDEPQYTIRH